MFYLKIISIAIPYLVFSYFAWKEFRNKNYYTGTQLVWTLITIVGYFFYLLWLFGAFK